MNKAMAINWRVEMQNAIRLLPTRDNFELEQVAGVLKQLLWHSIEYELR